MPMDFVSHVTCKPAYEAMLPPLIPCCPPPHAGEVGGLQRSLLRSEALAPCLRVTPPLARGCLGHRFGAIYWGSTLSRNLIT
jgi:hypothetical protein